jgi:hypothetical protein
MSSSFTYSAHRLITTPGCSTRRSSGRWSAPGFPFALRPHGSRSAPSRRGRSFNRPLVDGQPPAFLTQDEESSGIIDAEEILGRGWFLLDVQVPKLDVAGSTPVARSPGLVEERIQADTRPLAIVEQAQ